MSKKQFELGNKKHEGNRTSYENAARDIIDYVLVYEENENHEKIRQIFERNLRAAGLKLTPLDRQDDKHFIKIYAPKGVLLKYCEILKMRMPLKIANRRGENLRRSNGSRTKHGLIESFLNAFKPDLRMLPEDKFQLTEHFSRDKSYLFDVDSEKFFPTSERSMIVNFILSKERFIDDQLHDNGKNNHDDEDNYGIAKLISLGVYEAAYPLHNDKRELLLQEWSSMRKLFKIQPLDYIKDYFGVKISLYYAWIGFYSYMLVPASVLGFICMLHGFLTLSKDNISTEVCKSNVDIIMCPQCDKHCDYWNLREICTFSFIAHLFDNSFTVVFTVLMSLWSALYLNLWNRYSAQIVHRWGIADDLMQNTDLPTVQYLNSVSKRKGKCDRLQRVTFSMAVVTFWLALVLAVVLGLMFYRISLSTSETIFGVKSWVVIITGSIFDLITILILNHYYDQLALWLTEKELHRTQNEFDNSLTWKIYLFWFINYYSSIIYVAFFQGKFIGRPGAYRKIFGFRQEECGPAGCIVDLFIQIATIMIGDLTFNNILEHLVPYVQKKIRSRQIDSMQDDEEKQLISSRQWLQDLKLLYWGNNELTNEYLEMILQYGFVTLFVAAFPLAPLVALINNIFEIRMDAKKLLINYRRPVAQNAQNIGIWLTIMNMISRISILSNACIIAFSTNFIPQMFYKFVVSPDNVNVGFFNHTLAYFDTSDFEPKVLPILSDYKNISICRYTDYRNPPWHEDKYDLSKFYWHILAAKLIFVLMYQNIVVVLQMLVCWLIPEMPKKLRKSILNEALKTQNIVLMNTRTQDRKQMYFSC